MKIPLCVHAGALAFLTALGGVVDAQVLPVLPTAGQRLWLKADAGVTTTIGGEVTQWADQSGAGILFTPGSTGPTLVPNVANGLPALRFSGSEYLLTTMFTGTTFSAVTVMALVRWTPTSSGNSYCYTIGSSGTSGSQLTLSRRSGQKAYHYDGALTNVEANSFIPPDTFQVFAQVYGETGPTSHRLYQNAGRMMDTAAQNSYAADGQVFRIGGWSFSGYGFVGDIIEFVVYDRVLTTAERRSAEEYLRVRVNNSRFQDVDLNTWSVVQYEVNAQPDAQWSLDNSQSQLLQAINADPSIYLGDFEISNTEITGSLGCLGAPDYIGFVFGYQGRGSYYLFDWKRVTAQYRNFGFGNLGMSLRIVKTPNNTDPTGKDLWGSADTANVTTLRDNAIPWATGAGYRFRLRFRPGSFEIEIKDGSTVLESWTVQDPTFQGGRFGYYINSCQNVLFERVGVEPLTPQGTSYGTGCPGAGNFIPQLEVSGDARSTGTLTVRIRNAKGGGSAFLFVGLSRANLPLGGGCSLLVLPTGGPVGPLPLSGGAPGTGRISFTVPSSVITGITVRLQAFVLDAASPIGASATNAVEIRGLP